MKLFIPGGILWSSAEASATIIAIATITQAIDSLFIINDPVETVLI